jgi:hypothetical protein
MMFKALTLNDRILLYLSAAGASCALYRNGTLREVHSLACDEEGWEDFNALLLKHTGRPVAIAVDTVDEVYRQDILPRARGADRREMTERRLRQLIHHSAYRAALRQKSLSDLIIPDPLQKRRQERYLMMGLTNAEIVRPWLDIMHVRGSHLAGIWLLPALAIPLARQFKLTDSRLLLVSEQTGGLRLTYLEQGELRFSRLAPVDSSQYDNPLEGYAEEIERTRQALVGQRLLARSEPLRTLLLDPLNTLAQLHALLPESAGFQCESILRSQLLDTLKLPPTLLAESSDALYLKLLPEAPQSANLMTREQHAVTHLHWLRRGFLFVTAAWTSLALIASALLWLDTWRLEQSADQAQQASMQNLAKEGQLLAAAGGKQALEQRRDAVEAWHHIARLEQDPAPLFELIQRTGKQIGNLQIRQLTWSSNAADGFAQQAQVNDTESGTIIEGEIEPFDNDFVAAHQRVQRLVDQLQAGLSDRHRIKVLRWPLDSDSGSALEGEFGHSRINARFRIQITEIQS